MTHGYDITQCGLYSLKSRRQLAARLGRSRSYVIARSRASNLYREWHEPKKSGGLRLIEAPRPDLKSLQRRIAELLQRVAPPAFLFSPVRRRSYVDNAVSHRGAKEIRLLDIDDYFGRCTSKSVYAFFNQRLQCAADVAYIMTCLTTRNGHLPQGSPTSPILSFYSCFAMWEEIAALVAVAGCRVTVYVDDITISGTRVPEKLVWQVKQLLRHYGHSHNRRKERRHFGRAAEITGIIVGEDKLCVPHRHYQKLQRARVEARLADSTPDGSRATARARSLEAQIQALQTRKRSLSS